MADWDIRLDRLRVWDAQEESWISDGDEPYFVMIGFRSRFFTPNSTSAFYHLQEDDEWAEGSYDGDEHTIPSRMGHVSFADVTENASLPEVIGALAIAVESDATWWSQVRHAIGHVRDIIESQARLLVEDCAIDMNDPEPDIESAMRTLT
jgi:hypothetical protein